MNDYIRLTAAAMANQYHWSKDAALSQWLLNNRLDGFSQLAKQIDPNDDQKANIMRRLSRAVGPAGEKLQKLLAEPQADY